MNKSILTNPEWEEVDKKFCDLENEKGWKNLPVEVCSKQAHSNDELKKNFQVSDKDTQGWKQSIYPYCKSCYGLYNQVCDLVSKVADINNSEKINFWKKEDLALMLDVLSETVKKGKIQVKPLLEKVFPILESISNCIQSRWDHFGKCYFNNDQSKPSLIKADESHMSFITDLCKNILRLHKLYKALILLLEFTEEPNLKNFYLTDEVCFNICRHQIKLYGLPDDFQYFDCLNTNTQRSIGIAKSPNKNKERNRNKSIINSGHIVSQEKISELVNFVTLNKITKK
jgi:hypothetical protein